MCNSPCCESGKLENVKDNPLSLICSICGTIYDLIESPDFKKYDSPLKRPVEETPTVPETPHEEEEPERCPVCDMRVENCTCYESEYDEDYREDLD